MASLTNLEERFNAAVRTIQNLPSQGAIQPSNLTKLIFYGLYKQATVGPCTESQPSLFNYVARAKWEAWHRCQSMTKEQAMSEYIDEIRKIITTIPETNELIEFKQLIGLSKKPDEENQNRNDSSSSLSSTASSTSSSPSSDIDEYDDPSGLVLISPDEIPENNNQIPVSINSTRHHHPSRTHDSNNHNQRAILTALSTLQQDINNILERLNRLEQVRKVKSIPLPRWLPLAGFRRSAIAFILLWPFVAFILMRLFLHAKISIHFRRQRLLKV